MGTETRALQRHQDGIDPSPGGVLFFACPKKRTKRKGSPAAETTPVDGLRNRRGKNSLRSNSLPLFPGSAPRRPAQRQRAVCFPGNPPCPAPPSRRGQPPTSRRGILRGIVPTLRVGTPPRTLQRPLILPTTNNRTHPTIAGMARSEKSGTCGGACGARETNATLDKTILLTMELGNDPGTPNPVQKHHRSSG